MFTRCPACQTLFRVRAEILRAAAGEVRCGRCGAQFNALASLAEDPEALLAPRTAAEAAAPEQVAAQPATVVVPAEKIDPPVPPAGQGASGVARDAQPGSASDGPTPPVLSGISDEVVRAALLIDEPPSRPQGPGIVTGLAALILLLTLAGQWLYAQRVPLYGHPEIRPLLDGFCGLLACDLPLPREPGRVEVLERMVRDHPRVEGGLLVNLTVVSRAAGPIAYPVLELQLADIAGNRVAGRRFLPLEYLPEGTDPRQGLSPGQPLRLVLELVAPTTEVVSFQFAFL